MSTGIKEIREEFERRSQIQETSTLASGESGPDSAGEDETDNLSEANDPSELRNFLEFSDPLILITGDAILYTTHPRKSSAYIDLQSIQVYSTVWTPCVQSVIKQ